MDTQHTPVLLQKVIEELGVIPGGKYIDATYGPVSYTHLDVYKRQGLASIYWGKQG